MGTGSKKAPYIELPVFQGPLDLLLHLIQQHKVDIYEIPIAEIADQFIFTVQKMESLDMEVTSEFLVLAAQLLYLKSRSLLPKIQKSADEIIEEEELKQNLVDRLVTYKAFKNIAQYLNSRELSSGNRYFREVNIDELLSKYRPNPLEGVLLDDIYEAFHEVLRKVEQGQEIHYVQADDISIDLMVEDILRKAILSPQGLRFTNLLRYKTKVEIVVAFIALLELLKEGKIKAEQSNKHDIFIIPTERAWDFREEETV